MSARLNELKTSGRVLRVSCVQGAANLEQLFDDYSTRGLQVIALPDPSTLRRAAQGALGP